MRQRHYALGYVGRRGTELIGDQFQQQLANAFFPTFFPAFFAPLFAPFADQYFGSRHLGLLTLAHMLLDHFVQHGKQVVLLQRVPLMPDQQVEILQRLLDRCLRLLRKRAQPRRRIAKRTRQLLLRRIRRLKRPKRQQDRLAQLRQALGRCLLQIDEERLPGGNERLSSSGASISERSDTGCCHFRRPV